MNSGFEARCDSVSVSGQPWQFAIAAFGRRQSSSNARKPEAGGTPLQPMQHFANTGGRLQGKIAQGISQLFTKRQQALLTKQGDQLANTFFINVLHSAFPR